MLRAAVVPPNDTTGLLSGPSWVMSHVSVTLVPPSTGSSS